MINMVVKKKPFVKKRKFIFKKRKQKFKFKRRFINAAMIPNSSQILSFNNFFLDREMSELWETLDKQANQEWAVLLTGFDPLQMWEEDFFLYELPFLKDDYDKRKSLTSSVALDTVGEVMNETHPYERLGIISDTFYFDSFFYENLFLFLLLLFFVSKFLFFFFFISSVAYHIILSVSYFEVEEEQLEIFDTELDISHYTFTSFSFVEPPSLSSLFFSSDVWKVYYKGFSTKPFFK